MRFYGEQGLVRIRGSWGVYGIAWRGAGMSCSLWQAPHSGYLKGDGASGEPEAQSFVMFCFNFFMRIYRHIHINVYVIYSGIFIEFLYDI